jgi:hemerythrin-like domain-containing protein
MSERRFIELVRAHRAIDELFLRHQEALVERDLREADRLLFLLGDSLRRHLQDEEHHLVPALDESGEIAGATKEILLKEHERILSLLQDIETRVESLDLEGEGAARRIVELLDQEGVLKRLIEHHEAREESLVFPALDERVSAPERERLVSACWGPE